MARGSRKDDNLLARSTLSRRSRRPPRSTGFVPASRDVSRVSLFSNCHAGRPVCESRWAGVPFLSLAHGQWASLCPWTSTLSTVLTARDEFENSFRSPDRANEMVCSLKMRQLTTLILGERLDSTLTGVAFYGNFFTQSILKRRKLGF